MSMLEQSRGPQVVLWELKADPFPLSQPIFVASGTDYILKTGTNPGGIGRTTLAEIRGRRITDASKDPNLGVSALNSGGANIASVLTDRDAQDAQREVDGGVVLLGRAALKEYLWALRKGYGETINLKEEARLEGLGLGANERRKDGRWEREEEIMVRELEAEDAKSEHAPFEAPLPAALQGLDGEDDTMTDSAASGDAPGSNPLAFAPYRSITPASLPTRAPEPVKDDSPPVLLPPPATLPTQPPLLLVPFSHPFGIQKWPSKMLHFFNKRSDVRQGGECALAILLAQHRAFAPPTIRTPSGSLQGVLDDQIVNEIRVGEHKDLTLVEGERTGSSDLDFLAETDENPYHFRRSYRTLPSAHEYSKRTYYKDDLPPKLAVARELASGSRQPTKAEENYPPKMESELRKERLDKELRWRRELEGWAMVRSGSGVAWDEKWGVGEGSETPFRVYTMPTEEQRRELQEKRDAWYEDKKRQAEALEERLRSMPSPPADDE